MKLKLPWGSYMQWIGGKYLYLLCNQTDTTDTFMCTRPRGHLGRHADISTDGFVNHVWLCKEKAE